MLEVYYSGIFVEAHPEQDMVVMNHLENKMQGIPSWLPPHLKKGWPALCVDVRAELCKERMMSISVFTPAQNGPDIPIGIWTAWKCMDMKTWDDMRGCGITQTVALPGSGMFALKLLPRTAVTLAIGPAWDHFVKNLADKVDWSANTEGILTIYLTAVLDDSNRLRVSMQRGMVGVTLDDVYTNQFPFLEEAVFLEVDWQLHWLFSNPYIARFEDPRAKIHTGALPPTETKMLLWRRHLHGNDEYGLEYSLIIGYRFVWLVTSGNDS